MWNNRSKGWIGIDFGASAVKMAQIHRAGGRRRVLACRVFVRKTPHEHATIADWWEDVCRTELMREGFVGYRAACVLSASVTELHVMRLPEGSESETRMIIANDPALAVAGAGPLHFDFWDATALGRGEGSQLENTNVLSVAEDSVARLYDNLFAAGLQCQVIDGLPQALAGAVRMTTAEHETEPTAALDWGHDNATFCILYGGRPVFTRHLRECGYAAVLNAVSDAMGLNRDDARRLLATYGVCHPALRDNPMRELQEVLTDVISSPFGEIVAQLTKTLAYPELHRSRLLPCRLSLFGGGSTIANIGPLLASRIGMPVQPWRLSPSETSEERLEWCVDSLFGQAIAVSGIPLES